MNTTTNTPFPTEPLDTASPTSMGDARQKKDIDAEIAHSLEKLDLAEREKALFDLHGVPRQPISEKDQVCQEKSLNTMKEHLSKIKHGTAYELAEKLDFSYVSDFILLDMFLKSSDSDPYEAAEKMIQFFELKRNTFGVKMLVKDITLDDLNDEDKDYLMHGSIQILPFGDMSGRDIIMFHGSREKPLSLQSCERATVYICLESAKRAYHSKTSGVTVVYIGLEAPEREISTGARLWWSIPNRIAGIHLCTENIEELARDCRAITAYPAKHLARTRLHVGSYTKCHESLSAYGIPSYLLPRKFADSPTIAHHLEWYKKLEESTKKLSMAPPSAAAEYNEKDVLFGHKRNHKGNALMRTLVLRHQEAYVVAPKAGKVKLAREIVEQVHKSGGRFLRRNEEGDWVEVSIDKARDKVAHTFRNLRRAFH